MADDSLSYKKGLAALWRRRPLLTSAFIIAVALTTIFAVKAMLHFSYWNEHRKQPISAWMSPGYVARVWKIDEEKLLNTIDVTDKGQRGLPIARIAAMQQKTSGELIGDIQELIADRHGEPPS